MDFCHVFILTLVAIKPIFNSLNNSLVYSIDLRNSSGLIVSLASNAKAKSNNSQFGKSVYGSATKIKKLSSSSREKIIECSKILLSDSKVCKLQRRTGGIEMQPGKLEQGQIRVKYFSSK